MRIGYTRRVVIFATVALLCGPVRGASWYEAAGELSSPNVSAIGASDDGRRMRETVDAVVAEYDKIGAGNLARQCFDASRIVPIAENPTGLREFLFLVAGLISLVAALVVTKICASMFRVEIATLLWIPIAAGFGLLFALWRAANEAKKRKLALGAGVALSAAGVVSVIDPVRHSFFGLVADLFVWFTGWYVPLASAAIGLVGLLFVATHLFRNLGGVFGRIGPFLLRNAIGLVVIPLGCALVFLSILSVVGPWFDARIGGVPAKEEALASAPTAGVPFSSFSRKTRRTATEMARAAAGVYDGRIPVGAHPFDASVANGIAARFRGGNWNAGTGTLTTDSGLVAQILTRRTGSGTVPEEAVVVFRGTVFSLFKLKFDDVREDVCQILGACDTPQYDDAAALLRAVRSTTGLPIVLLGHSLGAGQAQYALSANPDIQGVRGVGFNTAGLSGGMLSAEDSGQCGGVLDAAGRLASVRLETDPVSAAGTTLGQVVSVPSAGELGITAHSIDNLVKAMERES